MELGSAHCTCYPRAPSGSVRLEMFPLKQGVKDRWKWRWESNGEYSTKSAYEREYHLQFRDEGGEKEVFKILWNNIAPLKIQIHAWKIHLRAHPDSIETSETQSNSSQLDAKMCIL